MEAVFKTDGSMDPLFYAIENLPSDHCILSVVPGDDPHLVLFSDNLCYNSPSVGLACLVFIPKENMDSLSICYNKQHQWKLNSFVMRNINVKKALRWCVAEQSAQKLVFFYDDKNDCAHSSAVRATCMQDMHGVKFMNSEVSFKMTFPDYSMREIDETVYLTELILSRIDNTLTIRINTQYTSTQYVIKIEMMECSNFYAEPFLHHCIKDFREFKSWMSLNRKLSKNNSQHIYMGGKDNPFISCKTLASNGSFIVSTLFTNSSSQKTPELQSLEVDSSLEQGGDPPVLEIPKRKKARQRA